MTEWCMAHPWMTVLIIALILVCADSITKQITWAHRVRSVAKSGALNQSTYRDMIRDPNKPVAESQEDPK